MEYAGKINRSNKALISYLCISVIAALSIFAFIIFRIYLSSDYGHYLVFLNLALIGAIAVLIVVFSFLFTGVVFDLSIPFSYYFRRVYVKVLFPVLIAFGRIFKVSRERLEQALIEINNRLVILKNTNVPPEKLLLLLPHCLQRSECDVKLSRTLDNCVRCGGCVLNELIDSDVNRKVKVAMARGGTEARNVIIEVNPKAVVAVACERDLISGIIDSYPVSVYGVVNERPFGYCKDTRINVERIKEGIGFFLN